MSKSAATRRPTPVVVVMGVSGVGKSTIAAELAHRIRTPWLDADDLHPPENVTKMASGVPLDDDDRGPWLDLVAGRLSVGAETDGIVVACSALRRRYRDRLRSAVQGVVFIHLTASPDLVASRARSRQGHFMPPALLESQFTTLEPLEPDERGTTIDVARPVGGVVSDATGWMAGHAG
jgi:gluconokinase